MLDKQYNIEHERSEHIRRTSDHQKAWIDVRYNMEASNALFDEIHVVDKKSP